MEVTIRFLEEELGLRVNREKSRVAPIKDISFLGFQILRGKIRVSNQTRTRFKTKVRELTYRNNPLSMYQVVHELNQYLRGWIGYFRIQEFRYLFRDLDAWIRSRLRSMQLKKWKKFQRIMIKSGFEPHSAVRTWVKMNRWQSVMRPEVRFVMTLEWFRRCGAYILARLYIGNLSNRQEQMSSVTNRGAGIPGRYVPFCRVGVTYGLPPTRFDTPDLSRLLKGRISIHNAEFSDSENHPWFSAYIKE